MVALVSLANASNVFNSSLRGYTENEVLFDDKNVPSNQFNSNFFHRTHKYMCYDENNRGSMLYKVLDSNFNKIDLETRCVVLPSVDLSLVMLPGVM